jgi:nitrite reductase (cytochrome c-552)
VDKVRTRYGGSEALPHTPTQADPRSVVSQSKLGEDPRLKIT